MALKLSKVGGIALYAIVTSSLLHGMRRLVCLQVQIRAEYWYIQFLLYLSHAGKEYTLLRKNKIIRRLSKWSKDHSVSGHNQVSSKPNKEPKTAN